MSPDPDTHEFLHSNRYHHPRCTARNVTSEGNAPCTCEELIDAEWNDYYKGDDEEVEWPDIISSPTSQPSLVP